MSCQKPHAQRYNNTNTRTLSLIHVNWQHASTFKPLTKIHSPPPGHVYRNSPTKHTHGHFPDERATTSKHCVSTPKSNHVPTHTPPYHSIKVANDVVRGHARYGGRHSLCAAHASCGAVVGHQASNTIAIHPAVHCRGRHIVSRARANNALAAAVTLLMVATVSVCGASGACR